MSSDSSNNVRKYFESESNTNKLESVQEDSNSEGQSTKGQNDNRLGKKNKSIQKEPNDGKIEEEEDDDKELNNTKDNNENEENLSNNNNNNNNEENENEENENEKGNEDNKNENEEEEEKDKEKEEEERKKEEEKINYMEIYKKLNEEYEIEHKNFGDKIKQLQIDLYSKSENLKKLTIRNHYLTINLKELNEKVDQMIKNSANKKFKILKKEKKISPELILKIKEKELKNSQTLVKILQRDNSRIKKLLEYQTETSSNELLNKIKEKDNENQKLKTEIKQLKNINHSNSNCLTQRNNLQKKIKNLELEITRTIENTGRIKNNYEIFQTRNVNSENANKKLRENIFKRKNSEKKRKISLNVKNNLNNTSNVFFKIDQKGVINIFKNEITSFSTDEIMVFEKLFENKKDEMENFFRKISTIEKFKNQFEKENKKILKDKNEEFEKKNIEINNLNSDNNYKDNEIKFLETQLTDFKNSKIILEKKATSIQKTIDNINNKLIKKKIEKVKLSNKIKQLQTVLLKKEYDPLNQNEINKILGDDDTTEYNTNANDNSID